MQNKGLEGMKPNASGSWASRCADRERKMETEEEEEEEKKKVFLASYNSFRPKQQCLMTSCNTVTNIYYELTLYQAFSLFLFFLFNALHIYSSQLSHIIIPAL